MMTHRHQSLPTPPPNNQRDSKDRGSRRDTRTRRAPQLYNTKQTHTRKQTMTETKPNNANNETNSGRENCHLYHHQHSRDRCQQTKQQTKTQYDNLQCNAPNTDSRPDLFIVIHSDRFELGGKMPPSYPRRRVEETRETLMQCRGYLSRALGPVGWPFGSRHLFDHQPHSTDCSIHYSTRCASSPIACRVPRSH